jgi:hypothetical protein
VCFSRIINGKFYGTYQYKYKSDPLGNYCMITFAITILPISNWINSPAIFKEFLKIIEKAT